MNEILQANDTNEKVMYPLYFMPPSECTDLSQKKLREIFYFGIILENNEHFLVYENETYLYEEIYKHQYNEVKLPRSGCFNTLPKRSKADKFKPRYGPKTQKYR